MTSSSISEKIKAKGCRNWITSCSTHRPICVATLCSFLPLFCLDPILFSSSTCCVQSMTFSQIFNLCLSSEPFPEAYKGAKGSPLNSILIILWITNLTSFLPFTAKLLERLVFNYYLYSCTPHLLPVHCMLLSYTYHTAQTILTDK